MQYKKLSNGIEIIVHKDRKLKNTVVNLLYKVGSAYETSASTGIAHFLEHLMFDGSQNYPHFDEFLEAKMGENNAFTGQDYTSYYETFPSQYLEDILYLEKDRMENLLLKTKHISTQENVIVEEFKETVLNPPMADLWQYLLPLCFKGSYSWSVIGKNLNHIHKIDRIPLKEFYQSFYHPQNLVISIVSNLPSKKIISQVASIFGQVKPTRPFFSPHPNLKSHKKRGYKQLKRKNISHAHFTLAFHIADFGTKEYFMADMLSDLLTNGESSALYQALISTGLCIDINSYTTDNFYCNLLILEGKLNEGIDFKTVYKTIEHCFDNIKAKPTSPLRFETLINKATTYWSFYHYNSTQLAINMALFLAATHTQDLFQFIEHTYQSISRKDLLDYSRQLLDVSQASSLEYIPN